MSTSTKIITDPRLSTNYEYLKVDSSGKYLVSSNDQTLINLQSYVNIIYSIIVLFNNENSNTNNLDKYAIIINNNINKILEIVKPCIQAPEDPSVKCKTNICKYMSDIENILLNYELILINITTGNGLKKKYNFLQFLLHYNFVKLITDNNHNMNLSIDAYSLCNRSTYSKPSDNPDLQKQFELLMSDKLATQAEVVQSNQLQFILNILIYIFASIIIYLIFAFLYKKYLVNKKEVNKIIGGLLNLHTRSKINNF